MKAKRLTIAGLILLLILGLVLVVSLRFPDIVQKPGKYLYKTGIPAPECTALPKDPFFAILSSWDPGAGIADITLEEGCKTKVYVEEKHASMIIVPINPPGTPRDEQIVFMHSGFNWDKAFCPGDRIYLEPGNQDERPPNIPGMFPVKKIQNFGTRACAFNK